MKAEQHEEIEIITRWGKYKHKKPSNRGMYIIIAILVTAFAIVCVCKLA